ncbi:MAG TPA: glycosyltransferase [Dongiaceae bacterium]|jgi:glycosyltransferase involved in cell wall biosynthesis|nr:glycosyltransferase [Dongiaceae bacterium]
MHRSGTSPITRALNLWGCDIASDLIPPAQDNPHGFWESAGALTVNDAMLAEYRSAWHSYGDIPAEAFSSERSQQAREEIYALLSRDFSRSRLLVIKEPRICRLFPLWRDALAKLGCDIKIVIPFRHPTEVARSLETRDGIPVDYARLLWSRYMLDAEYYARPYPRVFVPYTDLLGNWRGERRRLEKTLGVVLPALVPAVEKATDDFLRQDERHHRSEDAAATSAAPIEGLSLDLYSALREAVSLPAAVKNFDALAARFPAARDAMSTVEARLVEAYQNHRAFYYAEDARVHKALAEKDKAISGQAKEIASLHRRLAEQSQTLGQEIAQLNRELDEKLQALTEQAGQYEERIGDLEAVLRAKDGAIARQAGEHADHIAEMEGVINAKDETIAEMVSAVKAKEGAIARQAKEHADRIAQIETAIAAKDAAAIRQAEEHADHIAQIETVIAAKERLAADQQKEIDRLNEYIYAKEQAMALQAEHFSTEITRLREYAAQQEEIVRRQHAELRRLNKYVSKLWKNKARRLLAKLMGRKKKTKKGGAAAAKTSTPPANPGEASEGKAFVPSLPLKREHGKKRVLHVLANFMLGGSSRLVMDLVENLGPDYQHRVVTSYVPDPPAYRGVEATVFSQPRSPEEVLAFLREYEPELVHFHYWGDCDSWWYDIFFRAVQTLNCRVVENINTPVAPYRAPFIDRYIYVSNYVRTQFGGAGRQDIAIHPGSDFTLFAAGADRILPQDCIGMVYRLEGDKLNEAAIDVFIKVARRRPQTKVLIVGGGTYLEPYRAAVQKAELAENFEFTGYVDYSLLPTYYERMTLFVAPVWKESFGQVGPFAMNMGIPVVGYAVGGLEEIVDDPSLLAPPGDSDALADIISDLLDDPERCQRIGERNRARAQEHFSVERMVDRYRTLYAELVS